ncbi:putative NBD/HSP70 family sugar kinase [Phyllobacterium myrsinacearum]|uniref:Putative NBD/HSP70 family sugar kinase n=2 Tax=Phyllobacterium myrsinacearum TaxID=28101 RepID=A0A839ER10_9HYPH|nr:putative NBD/HSP70 family sugar kinase [Phyllobacterium myrsinacearum]
MGIRLSERHGPGGTRPPLHQGTNQSGMRDHNERVVLSLLRQHGSLAKTAIARMTGLSAQTISIIMRMLEADELLSREEPLRGRIGQPLIPMSLNPEGAFFLGLKIGRRSADLVLIDFVGRIRSMRHMPYPYPTPDSVVAFTREGIAGMLDGLDEKQRLKVAGLGIAAPFELWKWADTVGAPQEILDQWRQSDIKASIAAICDFPVYLQNDITAACGAELVFGETKDLNDFVYFYIGSFIGGGIVINGSLYAGRTGNAGALGSMPVPGPDGTTQQLIDIASITALERIVTGLGRDPSPLWTSPDDWGLMGDELDGWIDRSAKAIAQAVIAAASVVDFEAAVIDGWMPASVRMRIVDAVRKHVGTFDLEGIELPAITEGSVGIHARALGAASLALSDRFLIGQKIFRKVD